MTIHLSEAWREELLASTPEAVREFCQAHGLGPAIDTSLELVRATFRSDEVSLSRERDPELDEEWVTIAVTARGSQEEVLDAHTRYVRAWIKQVPEASRRYLRLFIRIA